MATALFLHSCQKEISTEELKKTHGLGAVTERAPNGVIYGVTVFDGVNPCRIVGIDENTGNVVSDLPAFYIDPNGAVIDLVDLKGICVTDGQDYFLTTGPDATAPGSPYNNALCKVNPQTGECGLISTSPGQIGAVSDLEFFGTRFVGLQNNTNSVVMIINNGATYLQPVAITGITPGFTLQGLSLVADVNGTYFVGCATSANPADRPELYKLVIGPFPSGIIGFLDPVNELGAGHCAIGYDNDIQQILVNRSNGTAPFNGLNSFNWLSTSVVIPTNFFGAPNYDFEDLTSWAY